MYIWAKNVKVIARITKTLIELFIYFFYSTIRKKLLGCVYRDHLETEETLENQTSEPGTNLQNKILQFREEYLSGIVHSKPTRKHTISSNSSIQTINHN